MTQEEKIEKLRKYVVRMGGLTRKCKEADLWDSMAEGKGGSVLRAGARSGGPDTIKETAIQIRRECEALAAEVAELRRELAQALDRMQDDQKRELLEKKYIEGKSNAQLSAEYGRCERTLRRQITGASRERDRPSGFLCE